MSELERYKACMDRLRAPEALYTEVWNMTEKENTRTLSGAGRRTLVLAAALALILALGVGAYAAVPRLLGWAGNFEIRQSDGQTEAYLHTDSLTDPVEIRDGRLWFVVNGEHTDITDLISETEPYLYDYTDEDGVVHYWIVGKNGPEPAYYGYGEFLYRDGEGWLGGYSARTNLPADGSLPAWLTAGKAALNIPW